MSHQLNEKIHEAIEKLEVYDFPPERFSEALASEFVRLTGIDLPNPDTDLARHLHTALRF